MRKLLKRWYVWLGLVLLLGLGGSVALICSSQKVVTESNFERLREGMTEAEVTVILGEVQQEFTGFRSSQRSTTMFGSQ